MKVYCGKRIVIDTDPGTDDALALAIAANCFKSDVISVVSSYGNVDGDKTYENLRSLIKLLGTNCSLFKGAKYPLKKNEFKPTDYHGVDGLGGVQIPRKYDMTHYTKNLNDLYVTIKANNHIVYVVLGPLTNFAKLLLVYPDVINYVDELIIMGGGITEFNMPHDTEYNFSLDPIADKIVIESNVKKTIAMLDLTHTLSFDEKDIEDVVGRTKNEIKIDRDFSAYSIMSQILYANLSTAIKHGLDGAVIHDATTFLYMNNVQACKTNEMSISVDEYGAIRCDNKGAVVRIISEIDKEYMKKVFKNMFKNLKGEVQ